ncbi:hypothetical protein Mesau_02305 [Mesorhizobium australicum WSM2073]|uniref:DGQHR domain-containing protein n=1 Tax=Mesorhizobium australicum (strain HAMBI 3006 / LMG 24608 / WSM2073) TaxID=754035 RepID=L0KIA3_MESAW|nr:hypothetical protein [Mesorhizobium australicum]AGB44741.1 hypothetical protein Mesau_02305 [Mesorhizobium australicum WSM2073]
MSSQVDQNASMQSENFSKFLEQFSPLEAPHILLITDHRTGARYCECHVKANRIIALGTTDVPLDPEEQAEYRANRQIVENAPAYARMMEDAKQRRSFSNIVGEFTLEFDKPHPLKIIGGQHRFEAIRSALANGIDEYHGVKVYFDLKMDQRLDVQLISNTNIAISGDLFDRMHETAMGPQLRDWFQLVGMLNSGQDFADRRSRGGPISVQLARTFILNYFHGAGVDAKKFDLTETTPELCPTGVADPEWEALRDSKKDNLWTDPGLILAGNEFAALTKAQRAAFVKGSKKFPPDYPEKATNPAVVAAWAFIAGMLRNNEVRLKRHYDLAASSGHDPLNVAALVKGRHKTDTEQYRGLGYRTDPKERGRFAELFFLQSENGEGISKSNIDVAIAKYHAKVATLEVEKLKAKAVNG